MCSPKFYRDNVPTNVRAFLRGIAGRTSPVDETFFRPEELDALRVAAGHGLEEFALPARPASSIGSIFQKLGPDDARRMMRESAEYPEGKYRDDYPNPRIGYRHYDRPWTDNYPQSPLTWIRDPSVVAQTTVGSANIERLPNGDVVLADRYNFPTDRMSMGGFMGQLHKLGELILPEGKNNDAGYPVRVNLGNPSTWKK